ncbi:MAG TPA: NAD(P)-binding domain-containing protein [Pseudomonadota bacterium]|nr:NAD(P)-binding domain-containing protein [Pseudomonadota bacterium]
MKNLKIGILGTGDVGRALGNGFVSLGCQVMMGSREAGNEKAAAWARGAGELASSGTFAEAAAFADIVVLATLWSGTENALRLAGAENLAGKILIDTTNPLSFGPQGPSLAIGHTDSGGESVQRWAAQAKVVKAWNIVGNPHMFQPSFPGGPPDMFIAGNDADAKVKVSEILAAFGWQVVDLGSIEMSRYLEPLAMVWIMTYFRTKSGNHAIKLLRK